MPRVSIRTLMAFIIVAGVGLAALRNANEFWAGMMLLLALATVGIAVLGGLFSRGTQRAWWVGFAVFGGGYLIVSLCPLGAELPTTRALNYVHLRVVRLSTRDAALSQLISLRQSRFNLRTKIRAAQDTSPVPSTSTDLAIDPLLKSKALLDRKIASMEQRVRKGSAPADLVSVADGAVGDSLEEPTVDRWRAMFPGAANRDQFERAGQSVFVLLAGLVGGIVATRFYARRQAVVAA
jgi:hypothetical protein